ncbi:hypothetical protein C2S51_003679 [Perilla frutescens var. frutescens]|nr:hypothetical protein C2S51_003679 [Perilla frutescens var. frutescens]
MEYSNGENSVKESTISLANFMTVRPTGENRAPEGLYKVSNLDQTVPYPIEVIFLFQTENYNVNVGEVLKQSLKKVLEEYYPLAGRLKMGCDGRMVVDCSGGGEYGIPFVEAFSDEEVVVAVGNIIGIDQKLVKKLVYSNHRPYETILDVPPLAVQVTTFKCGGVILGARFNHVFFDGIGFADFMASWSEIARGLPLSINPCLDRSILFARKSPKIEFLHPEYSKIERPLTPLFTQGDKTTLTKSFCFTPTAVSRLRKSGQNNNDNNNKNEPVSRVPTTFELISALAWTCWTKAKKLSPGETSQVVTAVNGRSKLRPPVAEGYFGNCIVWACAKSTAQELTSKPFSYAVGMVHNALNAVTEDYVRSAIDFHELTGRPLESENTMWITKWSRLPFYEIDFGWGRASKVAPGAVLENLAVILSDEKDSKNMVVSMSLPAEAMEMFQELIESELKS